MITVNFTGYNEYTVDSLHQWDKNVSMKLTGLGSIKTPTIYFANKISATAEPVPCTAGAQWVFTCQIPNAMLTSDYPIIAYIRVKDGTEIKTIETVKIPVIGGTKPDDYEYEDNIYVFTYEDLVSGIQNKVDKDGNEQITLRMLSQEVKEAITGGALPVVGVNSVNTTNIVDGAVTKEKLSPDIDLDLADGSVTNIKVAEGANIDLLKLSNFKTESVIENIDILKDVTFYDGYYINAKGVITTNATWCYSDPVQITANDKVTIETDIKNLKPEFHCYGSDDAHLGVVGLTEYSVAGGVYELYPLQNTAYIIVSLTINNKTSGKIRYLTSISNVYYDFSDSFGKRMKPLIVRKEHEDKMKYLEALLYNFTKWSGKSLVTDGNSLVASTNWGDYLAEFLGMTHTNCGNSGSMITVPTDTMDTIKANIANNYPANADLVILQGDTNGAMDGNYSDQMDGDDPKTTWTARMNYVIRCIKAKYHNVIIVLMPDPVRYDSGSYNRPKNTATLEAMRGLAEYNRLAFFNFDHSTPYNPLHNDNYYSRLGVPGSGYTTQDYVHHYTTYTKAKGYALAQYVAGLVFNPDAPNSYTEGWESTV